MIGTFPDMTRLWHAASRRILFADRDHLDRWAGLTAVCYDNVLMAKSMAFDFDVGKDLWLTKARFPKLQRDYLQADEVASFLDRCEAIGTKHARRGVITQMICRPANHRHSGEQQHVWGNCMLAFTYHGGIKYSQPTIGLHSRVSYIAYLGAMDMAVAWVLAREIAGRLGIEVEDMAFRWYVDSLQWHGFKSAPYVISQGLEDRVMDEERYPTREYPAVAQTRRSIWALDKHWESGIGLSREDNKYGPVRRMRQRYHRYMGNDPLPSIPLDQLKLLPYPHGAK